MNKLNAVIFTLVLAFVCLSGCSRSSMPITIAPTQSFRATPMAPLQPKASLCSIEQVVNKESDINMHKIGTTQLRQNASIGVLDFKYSLGGGAGTLVSDTFSIHLDGKKFKVVERQNIQKIIEEQNMIATGKQNLTEEQSVQLIGQLANADYMVFGAVTQYHFENTRMPIPYTIDPVELSEYLSELEEYKAAVVSFDKENDEYLTEYYRHLEHSLLRIVYRNDLNAHLHSGRGERTPGWHYRSFTHVDFDLSPSVECLPYVGKSTKELAHLKLKLEQDRRREEARLKSLYERHEDSIMPQDWRKAVSKLSSSSWQAYIRQGHEDNYIIKTKKIISDLVGQVKKINQIKQAIARCDLLPIPDAISGFDLPKDEERFVSVANLGITFKIIDVKTGGIMWIGQAAKRDFSFQSGLNKMVFEAVNRII